MSFNSIKDSKVAVIGGLGFIGSNLVRHLVAEGASVTVLERSISPVKDFNIQDIKDEITIVEGDAKNEADIGRSVEGKEIIFNLSGGGSQVRGDKVSLLKELEEQCAGHFSLLEFCRKNNPKAKIIFTGSRSQYGKALYNPVDEGHPTNPISFYGVNKLLIEKYYMAYVYQHNLHCTSLRITNPYGPRALLKDGTSSLLNWFIYSAIQGKDIVVFGQGEQIRDYIFIDDLIKAMVKVAYDSSTNGQIYNIGSGIPTRFIDMAEAVVDAVGNGHVVKKEWPHEWAGVETGDFYANIEKIKTDTGWKPATLLDEGVKKTADFYKKNLSHYI